MWGESFIYSDINDVDFGFIIAVKWVSASAPQASINYIDMTIYVSQ